MSENKGYVHYLEARLALLEKELQKQGAISMPPVQQALSNLDVGTVIAWYHRYPRGDVYKFVAFLQKSNEWHMVSGSVKVRFTHEELYARYNQQSLAGFTVLS